MISSKSLSVSLSLSLSLSLSSKADWVWIGDVLSMVAATLGGTKSETIAMWARSSPLFPEMDNRSLLICPETALLRFTTVETSTPAFFEHSTNKEKKEHHYFWESCNFFSVSNDECTAAHWGRVWDPSPTKKCNDLYPRDKPNKKIDVYDCQDILAILSLNMGRPAQLQPEKRSRQGRHLLFLHTKRLEIRGSRQIFCPTLAFARLFSGSRAQLWERSAHGARSGPNRTPAPPWVFFVGNGSRGFFCLARLQFFLVAFLCSQLQNCQVFF